MMDLATRPLPPEIKAGFRHRARQHSPFSATYSDTLTVLEREIRHLTGGPARAVLMIDVDERMLRIDGQLKANARPHSDDVAISVETKRGPLVFPCGSFWKWQDNVRAIALGMEALRKVDRYGISPNAEQYRGWQAIGPGPTALPSAMTEEQAARTLASATGEPQDWPIILADRRCVPAIYRAAAAKHHPDVGGDRAVFEAITAARDLLLATVKAGR